MDQQHKMIKGYRDLTQEEIDLMNRIKAFGPELEKLCQDLFEYHDQQFDKAEVEASYGNPDEYNRITNATPHMWRTEGMVSLQKGLMFLTRSVAQPGFF